MTAKFFGTHNHTMFSNIGSFKDSTVKVRDLLLTAHALGHQGVAITDHANISAHIQAIQTTKALKKEGKLPEDFTLALGVEAYVVDEEEMSVDVSNNERTNFYHLILIAKDEIGHHQIRQLTSLAYKRSFHYRGILRVPMFYTDFKEIIGNNKGHLIATSACLGGYLGKLVLDMLRQPAEARSHHKDHIYNFMCWAMDVFGEDNFYLELQPSFNQDQIDYNEMLIKIAKAYKLPLTIATDVHYLRPENQRTHSIFLKSDEKNSGGRELGDFYNDTYLHSVEEMREKMAYMEETDFNQAIQNTHNISQQIKDYDLAHDQIIPKIPLPPRMEWFYDEELYQMAKNYPHIHEMATNDEPYDNYLINLIFKGMVEQQVPVEKWQSKFERLDIECQQLLGISRVKGQRLSSYFITMNKCMDLIWEEAECLIGVGRGSAMGYLMNRYLNIVQVDCTEQEVEHPWWRFIHESKVEIPDIDIDLSSHKRDKVFDVLQRYFNSIGGEIVRVATFGTETSRSAITTACRGLGISSDVARHLSSLIPIERGKVRDLKTCYYGNEHEKPIAEFVNICNQYADLKLVETAIEIEGLVNKCSIHAAGVLITNEAFTNHNAVMVAPNGTLITAWNLGESEYAGGIKYDNLNTTTMSMIQTCVELLIKAGHMEWQGSLRATYDKYLAPDTIDLNNPELWKILNSGTVPALFQFDSPQGKLGLHAVHPASLTEVSATNTLIRLMVEDGEQPLDRYVRYRNNIEEWYEDMRAYGLNEEEIEIMKEYLLPDYGVMNTQEMLMIVSQSEKVSNFDVPTSNKLRKAIAKKNGKIYDEVQELFYQKGLENGCREIFLRYIWEEQVSLSKGYGFSILHSTSYSTILTQQLQLIHKYPPIYWACAVLQVESGSLEQETLDEEAHNEKTTNYGALATAISMLQQSGIKIEPPCINQAQIGFTPNETSNSIIYGLKGVSKINNDIAQTIINHRPYASFDDFVVRLVETKHVTKGQLISLIKAGAFDELEAGTSREELMERYLRSFFKARTTINDKFVTEVMNLGMIDPAFEQELKHYHFKAYLKTLRKYQDETVKAIKWHVVDTGNMEQDDYTMSYFDTHFAHELEEGRDYRYNEYGQLEVALGTKRKGSFEDIHSRYVQPLMAWLKSDDCLLKYNEELYLEHKDKYAEGTREAWEMDALSVYLSKHQVEEIDHQAHGFVSFYSLPEEAEIIQYNSYKGRQIPKFKLSRLVGCVVDKDKNKHMVSLLTPEGCITLKFHAGSFAHYDKVISVVDAATGTKTKLEDSWFKKGTLLAVTGYRQGDNFRPKTYADSIIKHSVQRLSFDRSGRLYTQAERTQI